LKCPSDFKVGYSPERINPGDKEHTIDKVVKVVSGVDDDALHRISRLYSKIVKAGVFPAKSIKTAEAAKVIENIQRDLNIALMNELSLIFNIMGLNTKDVLEAAYTKWNFHKYFPGLVGGHCIGVDPYYLSHKAEELGFHPRIILSVRATNDYMAKHVANLVIKGLNQAGKVLKNSNVLLLGLTFKENVRDPRNSRAKDIISELREYGICVSAYEPNLDDDVVSDIFDVEPVKLDSVRAIDCIVLVNNHSAFNPITLDVLANITRGIPVLVDVRNFFDQDGAKSKGFIYKSL
ncbi:nucleotide sugar dehydrogenase, partial [Candidatus Woesearchaeota archaeon]|nr:nucleotide sugar dehydrogenase [Candidatus Woesearchaeota archaeon]